jgi:glutamine amidotransferase
MSARDVLVVDLGLGNLRSVARALERAGAAPRVSGDPDVVRRASRVVVPGQGAFRDCARALEGPRGLGEALREHLVRGTPYLGLCLGMQVLFDGSDEAPGCAGLGWFSGHVARLPAGMRDPESGERLKVPHVGWNEVRRVAGPRGLHPGLPERAWFYFVHSYHCVPRDPTIVVATATYGLELCVAVARDHVLAVQFHPEKSQDAGARVLEWFVCGASGERPWRPEAGAWS